MSKGVIEFSREIVRELPEEIEEELYPYEAPPPLSDTELHQIERITIIGRLGKHYENRSDVYVWGDMFLYWEVEEGEGRKREEKISPDVFVVFGVPKEKPGGRKRKSFRVWREGGKVPAWVMEISSQYTWKKDMGKKILDYSQLGVKEYFVYDPEGKFVRERLVGFYRLGGQLVQRKPFGKQRRYVSQILGLTMGLNEKGLVEFYDRQTGERLLRPAEREEKEKEGRLAAERRVKGAERRAKAEANARKEAEMQREAEAKARKEAQERAAAAEEELRRLKAELECLRKTE